MIFHLIVGEHATLKWFLSILAAFRAFPDSRNNFTRTLVEQHFANIVRWTQYFFNWEIFYRSPRKLGESTPNVHRGPQRNLYFQFSNNFERESLKREKFTDPFTFCRKNKINLQHLPARVNLQSLTEKSVSSSKSRNHCARFDRPRKIWNNSNEFEHIGLR